MDKFESKLNLLNDDQLKNTVGGTNDEDYEVNVVDWVIVSS